MRSFLMTATLLLSSILHCGTTMAGEIASVETVEALDRPNFLWGTPSLSGTTLSAPGIDTPALDAPAVSIVRPVIGPPGTTGAGRPNESRALDVMPGQATPGMTPSARNVEPGMTSMPVHTAILSTRQGMDDDRRRALEDLAKARGRPFPRTQPAMAVAQPAPGTATVPTVASTGCNPAGDITQLLSPACMGTLRKLQAPGMGSLGTVPGTQVIEPVIQAGPSQPRGVPCSVVIFATGREGSSPPVFQADSVQQCIQVGTRMSYGMPGMSNITAIDPAMGMVAISCTRDPPGTTIGCKPQEP